jgi:outer membrane lipoprotein SlyB
MKMKLILSSLLVVSSLSADMGQIVGGAVGGIIGHQFGGGNGKVAATIGGAVLGTMIGGSDNSNYYNRGYNNRYYEDRNYNNGTTVIYTQEPQIIQYNSYEKTYSKHYDHFGNVFYIED